MSPSSHENLETADSTTFPNSPAISRDLWLHRACIPDIFSGKDYSGRTPRPRDRMEFGFSMDGSATTIDLTKTNLIAQSSETDQTIEKLSSLLKKQHVTYLFPHPCPSHHDSRIGEVDPEQTERFPDHFPDSKVIPWITGILHNQCSPEPPNWRKNSIQSFFALSKSHSRFPGLQINIEPLLSGNFDFFLLLDEL